MAETKVESSKVTGEGVAAGSQTTLCPVWEPEEKGCSNSEPTKTERRLNLQERQPLHLRSSYMFLEDSQVEMSGDQQGLDI